MNIETMEFDSVPADENCQCVGPDYNPDLSRLHAVLYKRQILAQFGADKLDRAGVSVRVKVEYGNYTIPMVVISYNADSEQSSDLAYLIENTAWNNWSKENRDFLRLFDSPITNPDMLTEILHYASQYNNSLNEVINSLIE
jgi:hypothetical protein